MTGKASAEAHRRQNTQLCTGFSSILTSPFFSDGLGLRIVPGCVSFQLSTSIGPSFTAMWCHDLPGNAAYGGECFRYMPLISVMILAYLFLRSHLDVQKGTRAGRK